MHRAPRRRAGPAPPERLAGADDRRCPAGEQLVERGLARAADSRHHRRIAGRRRGARRPRRRDDGDPRRARRRRAALSPAASSPRACSDAAQPARADGRAARRARRGRPAHAQTTDRPAAHAASSASARRDRLRVRSADARPRAPRPRRVPRARRRARRRRARSRPAARSSRALPRPTTTSAEQAGLSRARAPAARPGRARSGPDTATERRRRDQSGAAARAALRRVAALQQRHRTRLRGAGAPPRARGRRRAPGRPRARRGRAAAACRRARRRPGRAPPSSLRLEVRGRRERRRAARPDDARHAGRATRTVPSAAGARRAARGAATRAASPPRPRARRRPPRWPRAAARAESRRATPPGPPPSPATGRTPTTASSGSSATNSTVACPDSERLQAMAPAWRCACGGSARECYEMARGSAAVLAVLPEDRHQRSERGADQQHPDQRSPRRCPASAACPPARARSPPARRTAAPARGRPARRCPAGARGRSARRSSTNTTFSSVKRIALISAAVSPPPGANSTMAARARMIRTLRAATSCRIVATPRTRARTRAPASRPAAAGHVPCAGAGSGTARGPVGRLGREAVADAEVGVDVAPARRGLLELLAQLAHEHVDRAVAAGHRVAPDALVDLLALEHAALGPGEQLDAARTRGGSGRPSARRRTPGSGRRGSRARPPTTGPASARASARRRRRTTASTRAISSSGWQGLVSQSSAPSRSPRTRWATVDCPVQTTMPRPGSAPADPLEVLPRLRAEHGEVDDERAEAHRDERVERHRPRRARGAPSRRRSSRLPSTCRKPESVSMTAIRSGGRWRSPVENARRHLGRSVLGPRRRRRAPSADPDNSLVHKRVGRPAIMRRRSARDGMRRVARTRGTAR